MNGEREHLPPGAAEWFAPESEEIRKEEIKKRLEGLGLPVDLENRPIKGQLDIVTKRLAGIAERFSGADYNIRRGAEEIEDKIRENAFSSLVDLVSLRVGILEKLKKSKSKKS